MFPAAFWEVWQAHQKQCSETASSPARMQLDPWDQEIWQCLGTLAPVLADRAVPQQTCLLPLQRADTQHDSYRAKEAQARINLYYSRSTNQDLIVLGSVQTYNQNCHLKAYKNIMGAKIRIILRHAWRALRNIGPKYRISSAKNYIGPCRKHLVRRCLLYEPVFCAVIHKSVSWCSFWPIANFSFPGHEQINKCRMTTWREPIVKSSMSFLILWSNEKGHNKVCKIHSWLHQK